MTYDLRTSPAPELAAEPAAPSVVEHREQSLASAGRWAVGGGTAFAGFLLLTIAVLARLTDPVDLTALQAVLAHRAPALTSLARVLTDLGSYRVVVIAAVLLAVVVAVVSRRLLPPLLLLAAVASTTSLELLVKAATSRLRPPVADVLGAPASDYSFPSGHTTSGSTVYLLAALLLASYLTARVARRLVVAAGVLLAVGIGWSRVYLGYHWLSDVLGGWLLAATLGAAALAIIALSRRRIDPVETSARAR